MAVARELVEELGARGVDTTIAECQCLIASKVDKDLKTAQGKLKELLGKQKEYVPALVTMGLCCFLLKKSADAKNYLKTVVKNDF